MDSSFPSTTFSRNFVQYFFGEIIVKLGTNNNKSDVQLSKLVGKNERKNLMITHNLELMLILPDGN
jgi:hypothetical protein